MTYTSTDRQTDNNTVSKRHSAIAMEKAERLPPDHPKAAAIHREHTVQHRTSKSSWRREADEYLSKLPHHTHPKEKLLIPREPPWELTPSDHP